MNLNPLYELKERLESGIIAGVSLLSEDFRLARAVEQIEPLSKASPVFQKIYQSAMQLLSDEGDRKGDMLLDILGFVDAVLTTQAVTEVEGSLEPLEVAEGSLCCEVPYSQLAPLLLALSTSGSGHYSMIVEAHDKNPEIFSDYRLKTALVAGLNAGYSELAEQIERWLCEQDASLLPLLKKGFDPKGKKEMARRVHVVEAIAGAGENAWYLSMLPEAEKEVRTALIQAMRHSQENREIVQGFTKTEKGNCKKAALWSMARMEGTENLEFWESQIRKNPAAASKYLAFSVSDEISDLIADAVCRMLDGLEEQAKNETIVLEEKDRATLQALFDSLLGKSSQKMLDLYRRLASQNLLAQIKTEDGKQVEFDSGDTYYAYHDNAKIPAPQYLAELLLKSMIFNCDKRLFALAEELYQEHAERFLKPALAASLLTKGAAETYDKFSVWLTEGRQLKKESQSQKLARQEIMDTFAKVAWRKEKGCYQFLGCYHDEFQDQQIQVRHDLFERPDIRWIELFTDPAIKKTGMFHTYRCVYSDADHFYDHFTRDWDLILENLICPFDEDVCRMLGNYFYKRAQINVSINNYRKFFPLLQRCKFSGGRGLVVKGVQKVTFRFWDLLDLLQSCPMPLSDQVKELEEIKMLVDDHKVTISGWNEEKYQDLRTVLLKKQEEQETQKE